MARDLGCGRFDGGDVASLGLACAFHLLPPLSLVTQSGAWHSSWITGQVSGRGDGRGGGGCARVARNGYQKTRRYSLSSLSVPQVFLTRRAS